jgi:tetratricopeptide (TPR) repeat protein
MLTDSPEAFRALSGNRVPMYRNQLADARAAADAAIEIDPAFASAHVASAAAALLLGDQAAARDAIAEALRHAYRLPERSRLFLQMLDRMLFRMDPAGALQTGGYWTELYPQDPLARELLAAAYGMQGDVDGQIAQYRALIAIDSTDGESLRAIADVFQGKQDYDSALVYYARLAEMQPADVQTRVDIAATRISLLEFDEARDELERARIAAPDDPDVLSRLAGLDLQQGSHDDAARRLEQMSTLARTPQQRALVAGFAERYFYSLGQYGGLLEAHGRRLAAIGEFLPPISAVVTINDSEALTFAGDWGREADALAEIDSLRAGVEEPWSLALDVAAVQAHLDRDDIESAAVSLAGLRALSESFGEARVFARIAWVEGRIAELEDGDCGRALESYEEARQLSPQSPAYRAWLTICLTSLERWEEAEVHLAWLLERFPGFAMIRLVAAQHYAARGRTDEAIAELEIALGYWSTADSDYRPAQEARALLDDLQAAR